jgi:hypothetical protein
MDLRWAIFSGVILGLRSLPIKLLGATCIAKKEITEMRNNIKKVYERERKRYFIKRL